MASSTVYGENVCTKDGLSVTVLGAGGPELDDGYASTGYVVWVADKARLIVDAGTGSSLNFADSGAEFSDISAILLTHLHVDHAGDLPGYIKGSYFTPRDRTLKVLGPAGNRLMPDTTDYVSRLLGKHGAFAYLQDYVEADQTGDYKLVVENTPVAPNAMADFNLGEGLTVRSLAVHHGPVAAVAWRVNYGHCSVVFSGDMRHGHGAFPGFARHANLLVMHNAVPEGAGSIALNLHMPPSVIGELADKSGARSVLLSHFMGRTLRVRPSNEAAIRKHFDGRLVFAEEGKRYYLD